MNGLITTIQRMSIHDGPGIRSTIFVKGCNLRCKWCHNPETFSPKSELEWIADKCINCGACVEVCMPKALDFNNGIVQFDKSKCTACFHCVEHCFPEALVKIGRKVSPTEVFTEIAQDFPYFKESNGGITISGGEPMLQFEFVRKTLQLFHQAKIHTAIETNLSVSWDKYKAILPYINLVMADLKLMDSVQHKTWTNVENKKILENILALDKTGIPYYLRTPVVPGVNHSEQQIEEISSFVSRLKNIQKFELLPFHPLADSKYKNLGIENPFKNVKALSTKELKNYHSILEKYKLA